MYYSLVHKKSKYVIRQAIFVFMNKIEFLWSRYTC